MRLLSNLGVGSEKPCVSLPGSGTSAVNVSALLTGLNAKTFYHFRVVAINAGGTSNGSDQTFTTVIPLHTLIVNKVGSGSGSVTCNGGSCAASYDEGTKVTLVASAASGSTFVGWSGGCSGTGSCVVTVNSDMTVTATFDKKPSPPPPPLSVNCVVPKLAGKSLGQAKSALKSAHCTTGKVTKPKAKKGKKLGGLVVKSSSPTVGVVMPDGSKVNLKLGPKPKKKKKK